MGHPSFRLPGIAIACLALLTIPSRGAEELRSIGGIEFSSRGGVALEGDHVILPLNGNYWMVDFESGMPLYEFRSSHGTGRIRFREAIDLDGNAVVFSGAGGTFLFDAVTGNQIRKLSELEGYVAVSGDHVLLSSPDDMFTFVYDRTTGLFLREVTGPDGIGIGGVIDLDGGKLILSRQEFLQTNEDGSSQWVPTRVFLIDVSTGAVLHELEEGPVVFPDPGYARFGFHVAIEGDFAVVSSYCGQIDCVGNKHAAVYDTNSGELAWQFGGESDLGESADIDGDYAFLGAPGTGHGVSSSFAEIYSLTSGFRIDRMEKDTGPGRENFGARVALSGNRAVVASAIKQYAVFYHVDLSPTACIVDQILNEADGSVMIEVSLSPPSPVPVTIEFAVIDGEAVQGQDFSVASSTGSLTIEPGETSGWIELSMIDDALVEGTEAFMVQLSNSVGAALDQESASAAIHIEDDEWFAPAGAVGEIRTGFSLSADGNALLVGMPGGNDGAGSAAFLDVSVTTGTPLQEVIAVPDATTGDEFGFSVAMGHPFFAVGARQDDDAGSQSGSVYIFHRSQQGFYKLTGQDAGAGSRFGQSLAIDGDRLLVGAHRDDENGPQSGSAHVFRLFAAEGLQTMRLLPDDGEAGAHFGRAVAVQWPTAVVGAPRKIEAGESSGAVYLFDSTTGTQVGKLFPPDGEAGDSFGAAVTISGDRVFVGAPDRAGGGAVYVFRVSTGDHLTTWLPESPCEQKMGFALAASTDFVVVGIPGADTAATDQGRAALYDLETGNRMQILEHYLVESGQQTGRAVALGLDHSFAGAPYSDAEGGEPDAGSVIGVGYPVVSPVVRPQVRWASPFVGLAGPDLHFIGEAGVSYREERSSDLTTWIPTDSFEATGWSERRTPGSKGKGVEREFYRYVELP